MHVLTESRGRAHSRLSLSKGDLATVITHPATSLKDIDLLVENLQYKCISKNLRKGIFSSHSYVTW